MVPMTQGIVKVNLLAGSSWRLQEVVRKKEAARNSSSLFLHVCVGEKRVRFKEGLEANSEQVQSAMQKIASHIGNPTKFRKASKLAVQLLEAGNVSGEFSDTFFSILKAAMTQPSRATEAPLRADYCALFSMVQQHIQVGLCICVPQVLAGPGVQSRHH